MPWLAEALIEAHRDLKTATLEQAREIRQSLMWVVKMTTRGPWGQRMMERSNSWQFLMMELPNFVYTAISLKIDSRHIAEDAGVDRDPEDDA